MLEIIAALKDDSAAAATAATWTPQTKDAAAYDAPVDVVCSAALSCAFDFFSVGDCCLFTTMLLLPSRAQVHLSCLLPAFLRVR